MYWWVLLVLSIFVITVTVTVIACKKRKLESERPCGKMPSQPHRELRDGDRELGGPDEACGMQPGSLCDWGASPCLQRGSGTGSHAPRAPCPDRASPWRGAASGAVGVEHPVDSRLLCVPR